MRVDRSIAAEVLDRLQPLEIEAALSAAVSQDQQQRDKLVQMENALEQARFDAKSAQRQFDAVDPDNRLVAEELETRWNNTLSQQSDLQAALDKLQAEMPPPMSVPDRDRLMTLGADLARAWESPGVTPETRKRILRLMIRKIIVDMTQDSLPMIIHWEGRDHTRLNIKKNKVGHTRWVISSETLNLIRVLEPFQFSMKHFTSFFAFERSERQRTNRSR